MDPPPTKPKRRMFRLAPGEEVPPGTVLPSESKVPESAERKEDEKSVALPPPALVTADTGAPKAPASRKQRKFRIVEEKEAEQPYEKKLQLFYEKRQKDPLSYTYTPEGNLVERIGGVERTTLPLRRFRPLTFEEQNAVEEAKSKAVVDLENSVDVALTKLRATLDQYSNGRASSKAVYLANQEVSQAQKLLSKTLYPHRLIDVKEGLQYKDVRMDRRKDDRALGYDVFLLKRIGLKEEDFFGRYMTPEEEEALKTKIQEGGKAQDVYILETPDDSDWGGLHPAFIKDFSYSSTQYSSPLQAFEVERVKALKNDSLAEQMLRTRSTRTISNLAQHDRTPAPNAFELWTGILKAYYAQEKQWADKLKGTGDALFLVRDTSIPSSQEFLKALVSVRASLREGEEAQMTGDVMNRVISEEEQKKAKVGAIIRNKFAHRG